MNLVASSNEHLVHLYVTLILFHLLLFSPLFQTSELELETFFSAFGEVVDVRIVCDRKTGLNKG